MARRNVSYNRFPSVIAELDPKVQGAIRAGAEAIAVTAQGRVPVASGDLRNAIHVEDEDDGYLVVAGSDDVFYGHLVEFGTTHSPAHPFLVPSAESNRDTVVAGVTVALRSL